MSNAILDINRELASRINAEARSNPQSPYANKFVGIANGKVAVVGDNLDELVPRLRQIEPDAKNCFFVEASRDYDEVHEIWGPISCRAPPTPPKMPITEIEPPGTGPHHANARLRKLVTFNLAAPNVEEVLDKLRQATGVKLARADDIQNKHPATGSISVTAVPAWQVMDDLAESDVPTISSRSASRCTPTIAG